MIGFWIVIFVITVGPQIIDPRRGRIPETWVLLHEGLEYLMWMVLTPAIFWLARRYNLERDDWRRVLVLHVAVIVGMTFFMQYFGHVTWVALSSGGREGASLLVPPLDIFGFRAVDELLIYLAILGTGIGRDYFLRYQERREEAARLRAQAAELEAQLAEARLDALRMQINPHFLFNTLHAVSTLVTRNPEGVQRMIARLSTLLRYALESTSTQEVPLGRELDFLDDYLEIQRIRFEDRLEIEIDIDPAIVEALVPSLVLQPLVENAVKHGASRAEGFGRVEVVGERDGNDLVLEVRDNGPGLPEEDLKEDGVGLSNTRQRLQNLYGSNQSLTVTQHEEGGVAARIRLPFHTESDFRASPSGGE